jgi:drug/metabolite transporter (DMT)-like permease
MAIVCLLGNGIYPLISNERPAELDPLFFSWMTVLFEWLTMFPLYLGERLQSKKSAKKTPDSNCFEKSPLNWSDWGKLIVISSLFSIATIAMVFGLNIAGSISGSIALKTAPLYALFIGAILLKERMSWTELGLTLFMLTGLYFMATHGTWSMEDFSIGVGILLVVPLFWGIGHAMTKPLLQKNKVTPLEIILIRTGICTIIIGFICVIMTGWEDLKYIFEVRSLLFMIAMGFTMGVTHIAWYNSIRRIHLGLASALIIPSPMVTILIAIAFMNDQLYGYQVIGIITSLIGLYGLILLENRKKK